MYNTAQARPVSCICYVYQQDVNVSVNMCHMHWDNFGGEQRIRRSPESCTNARWLNFVFSRTYSFFFFFRGCLMSSDVG